MWCWRPLRLVAAHLCHHTPLAVAIDPLGSELAITYVDCVRLYRCVCGVRVGGGALAGMWQDVGLYCSRPGPMLQSLNPVPPPCPPLRAPVPCLHPCPVVVSCISLLSQRCLCCPASYPASCPCRAVMHPLAVSAAPLLCLALPLCDSTALCQCYPCCSVVEGMLLEVGGLQLPSEVGEAWKRGRHKERE